MKFITNTTSDLKLRKKLSVEQAEFIKKESIFPLVFNFFLNCGFGFIIFRGVSLIPRLGGKGFFQDLIICVLLTAVINGMDGFKRVEKGLIKGKVKQSPISEDKVGWFRFFPKSGTARGIVFGLLFGLTTLAILYLVFNVFSIDVFPFWPFVIFKGLLCAAIAGTCVYFVGLASLHLDY